MDIYSIVHVLSLRYHHCVAIADMFATTCTHIEGAKLDDVAPIPAQIQVWSIKFRAFPFHVLMRLACRAGRRDLPRRYFDLTSIIAVASSSPSQHHVEPRCSSCYVLQHLLGQPSASGEDARVLVATVSALRPSMWLTNLKPPVRYVLVRGGDAGGCRESLFSALLANACLSCAVCRYVVPAFMQGDDANRPAGPKPRFGLTAIPAARLLSRKSSK